MSKKNNHNPIYFLTTLSVYLGLVLVGASPQVLAQTDLTKNSKLAKPKIFSCPYNGLIDGENEKNVNPFKYDLAKRFIELIKTTDIRIEIVKADDEKVSLPFLFKQIEFAPYFNKNGKFIDNGWESKSSDWSSAAHAGQISELHSLFLTPLADCSEPTKRKSISNSSNITIDYDWLNSELKVQKHSESRANELVKTLRNYFFSQKSKTADRAEKIVYENTQVYAENNQVMIITRLPRASIDSLIKSENQAK